MYVWRMALWAAASAAAGAAVLLFHGADTGSSALPFLLCLVLAFVFALAAELYATGRKRREARKSFIQKFGSVDELRQAVDGPGLRRTRDEDGLLSAVRKRSQSIGWADIDQVRFNSRRSYLMIVLKPGVNAGKPNDGGGPRAVLHSLGHAVWRRRRPGQAGLIIEAVERFAPGTYIPGQWPVGNQGRTRGTGAPA
ncbi:hypothetical protein SAMN05216483_3707 [Streptomyces sp. 2131.1]|uniref:hypothetical protein n=1 Tax=Streptomyces sp. 2131.1 TaxID=1855346 RepID=UPI00089C06FA|nr:hypothetical protein [Streptomyces sp. 2131.1]SED37568.1 hypothetical protein SAMN05216483_3707 [Streptomyces sp. 2131.1]